MSWPQVLLAGFVGTLVLTTLEAGAQQLHISRMSIPYLLGTMLTKERDKARLAGFVAHLFNGQLFALVYVAIFHAVHRSGVWRGLLLGLAHSAVVLLVAVPLLPSIHPRMASPEQGPEGARVLEPPGPFAIHYGFSTPAVVVVAHAIFGMIIGWLYRAA